MNKIKLSIIIIFLIVIGIEVYLWYDAYYLVPEKKNNLLKKFEDDIRNLYKSNTSDIDPLKLAYKLDKDIHVTKTKNIKTLDKNDEYVYNKYIKLIKDLNEYDAYTKKIHNFGIGYQPRYSRYWFEMVILFGVVSYYILNPKHPIVPPNIPPPFPNLTK